MLQGDLPLKDSQKGAFFVSGMLHLFFFLFLAAQGLFAPPPHRSSKKLVVQSVALNTACTAKTLPIKKTLPQQQEVAFSEKPQAPEPVEEKVVPEPIVEEASTKEEKGSEKPVGSAITEESPPRPAPSIAKKPSKAPSQAPKAKTIAKTPPKKPQKSTPASSAKKANAPSAPSYDKRLVAEALSRLDKSLKATSGSGSTSSRGGSSKGSSGKVSRVGSVGTLHSDTGVSFGNSTTDSPEFGPTSKEGCYIADLIRRLQLTIRLPEPGEIRIKLTLKKSGESSSVIVVSCRNEKIKKSLLEKLKKVHFSPFGQSFPGEEEHTFLLRLSNDLTWSCS